MYAAWSQVRPDQVQTRTCQSDQSAWTSHLALRFGHVPVGSITSLDVQSFAHDLHARRCTGTRSTRFWPGDVRMVLFGFTALLRVRK